MMIEIEITRDAGITGNVKNPAGTQLIARFDSDQTEALISWVLACTEAQIRTLLARDPRNPYERYSP